MRPSITGHQKGLEMPALLPGTKEDADKGTNRMINASVGPEDGCAGAGMSMALFSSQGFYSSCQELGSWEISKEPPLTQQLL